MIERINELAKISKQRALSEEEKKEQAELRKKYTSNIKNNLKSSLEKIRFID